MSHPSCIKMPADAKEHSSIVSQRQFGRNDGNRDQICTRKDLTLMADEIFGVNKWSHSITNQTIDFIENREGGYFVGCSAIVRIQLANGTFHEDIGYSNSNATDKGVAIFSARKGSVINGVKNSLLWFGGAIAAKIEDFQRPQIEQHKSDSCSTFSMIETIPKKIVMLPNTKTLIPNAQSTPERSPIVEKNNKEVPPHITTERKVVVPKYNEVAKNEGNKFEIQSIDSTERMVRPSTCSKQVENGTKVNKPVLLTEEEKRLERKRRQAQLQEEFKKLHKDNKESADKPNARF